MPSRPPEAPNVEWQIPMRLKVLAAVALAALPLVLTPTPAQAAVRPATTCYGWTYNYTINSTHIQVNAVNACPGSTLGAYVVLEKQISGVYTYITSDNNGNINYPCNGTATNNWEIGPIFTVGVPSYTWHTFTDNCG